MIEYAQAQIEKKYKPNPILEEIQDLHRNREFLTKEQIERKTSYINKLIDGGRSLSKYYDKLKKQIKYHEYRKTTTDKK